jgi:hypothetical protein
MAKPGLPPSKGGQKLASMNRIEKQFPVSSSMNFPPQNRRRGLLLTLLLVGLLFQNGCISPPQYQDPVASLAARKKEPGRFANQSVTVVISENTEKALQYLAKHEQTAQRWGASPNMATPKDLADRLSQTLNAEFKTFQIVTNLSLAGGETDLTMVFDLQVKIGTISGQENIVDLTGIFVDRNQQPGEMVKGKGTSRVPYPAFNTKFADALNAAFAQFAANLAGGATAVAQATTPNGPERKPSTE